MADCSRRDADRRPCSRCGLKGFLNQPSRRPVTPQPGHVMGGGILRRRRAASAAGKVILDNTRILVISYVDEDTRGHRGIGRPCARAPARDLPIACATRPRRTAGRCYWRSCGPCSLVTDVSSSKSTALWTDHAAPREPSAHLLGRLRRDEWAGRLFDRELLRQQRRRMFTELRADSTREGCKTCGQSRVESQPWPGRS